MLGAMGLGGGGEKSHGGPGGRSRNCIQGLLCFLCMGCGSNNDGKRALRRSNFGEKGDSSFWEKKSLPKGAAGV